MCPQSQRQIFFSIHRGWINDSLWLLSLAQSWKGEVENWQWHEWGKDQMHAGERKWTAHPRRRALLTTWLAFFRIFHHSLFQNQNTGRTISSRWQLLQIMVSSHVKWLSNQDLPEETIYRVILEPTDLLLASVNRLIEQKFNAQRGTRIWIQRRDKESPRVSIDHSTFFKRKKRNTSL